MTKGSESTAAKSGGVAKHIISFALMIILTAIAFYLVATEAVAIQVIIPVIIGLAVLQVFLQLYIFMHLDQKGSAFPIFFIAVGIGIAIISAWGITLGLR
jgi:cytochrome c oxidase subunit IV